MSNPFIPSPRYQPKLIHLADYGGAYLGSFIPMLITLAEAARDEGWSVELVFSELARDRPWLDAVMTAGIPCQFVDVTRVGLGRWATWMTEDVLQAHWQGRLTNAISGLLADADQPTILHTHFSGFDVAAAHAAGGRPNAFVVWHQHSPRRPGWKPALGGLVTYRLFGRTVDRLVCVAPNVLDSIRPVTVSDKVRFLPNAVDVERFVLVTDNERTTARTQLGLDPEATVLLHFGSHWLRKGGDHYLAAVKLLSGRFPSRKLQPVTIGRQDAKTAVTASGLQSTVAVLEPIQNVRMLYAAADVLVSPSRSEGMPFATLEALAMGVPVVASDIPGHAFISDRVAACRITSLDAYSIASSIADVLNRNTTQRERETAEARRWIVEHMGLTSWAGTVMTLYRELLGDAQVERGARHDFVKHATRGM